jgi:hypothetical protein
MWSEEKHPRDDLGRFTKKELADMSADELKEYILLSNYESFPNDLGLFKKSENTKPFDILPERMSKKHIRDAAKLTGIDLTGITLNIETQEELLKLNITGRADYENIGIITFFPNAFKDKETLVRTIYHEIIHVKQFKKYGVEFVLNNRKTFEEEAYILEDKFITDLKKRGILDV